MEPPDTSQQFSHSDALTLSQSSSQVQSISAIPPESEFSHLKLAPFPFTIRVQCPICKHGCISYCPMCMKPLPQYPPPPITLPIRMDIIHHPKEPKVKSTAVQAIALCPTQADIWEFPNFPTFNPSETLFLYPSPDAKHFDEIDLHHYKRAVFVDSTWPQSKTICADPRLTSLTKISIDTHQTLFWRCQNEPPEFLATIEAIYFFYKAYIEAQNGGKYNGEVDNLLWYYVFQYEYIQAIFAKDPSKLASRKLAPSYYRARKPSEPSSSGEGPS